MEETLQEKIFDIIQGLTGQRNLLVIPREFIDYTGDIESALLLSQLVYWTDKSKDSGWVYKTYKEWEEEICLNKYSVMKAKKKLEKMGILETRVKKANGNPTVHYRLKIDEFSLSFVQNLNKRKCKISTNDSANFEQSITEITTETTHKLQHNYAEQVQQVFDYYLETFQGFFKTYTLTRDRRTKIEARLKEGYTVEQIKTAISNIRQSPFHCGENDRNKFYADITFICRSGSKLEEWINYQPPIHKEEETPTIWRRKLL